jgi:NTE family protein
VTNFKRAGRLSFGLSVLLAASAFLSEGALAPASAADGTGKPKVALVLGGGGTRGAAHVGVLRVLKQEGVPIDMVIGTSMGSIVGGLFCAGVPIDDIEARFDKPAIMKSYMTVPIYVRMAAIPFFAVPHLFGWHPYDGFYFGNKVRNYLNSCLPADKRDIEKLDITYRAVSTNLLDGKEYVISKGPVARAMQASSAIPVLRRPVPYDDGLLVDGAIVANVPVDVARKMGADIVIAVDVDERLGTREKDHFRKIGSVAPRIEQITLAHGDDAQLKNSDIVIHPAVDGIGVLSLKSKDARTAIKAGEVAAREALPAIRAKLNMPEKAAASRVSEIN